MAEWGGEMSITKLWLNLGSGQRKFKSSPWINIDTQAKWEPDVVSDATAYLSKLEDCSAGLICLHHVLEHFGCGEADSMLKECRRVLNWSGSLLIFIPDMWGLARMWKEGRITTQVYMTNVYGAYMGDEADRHKWGYSYDSLCDYLRKLGFLAGKFDWRKIEGADIAKDVWILGVEAVK